MLHDSARLNVDTGMTLICYVSHREAILTGLARQDPGRELATEFVRRHRLVLAEKIAMRPLQRMGERLRDV